MLALETVNKDIVRAYVEAAWSGPGAALFSGIYPEQVVYHNPATGTIRTSPDMLRSMLDVFQKAFPDATHTIDAIVGDGDLVAVLYTWSGTNFGDFGPIPATGRHVTSSGTIFCRLLDGKIVEEWDIDDRMHVMEQLGLMPAQAASV